MFLNSFTYDQPILELIKMSYLFDTPIIIPVLAALYLSTVYVVLVLVQRKQA